MNELVEVNSYQQRRRRHVCNEADATPSQGDKQRLPWRAVSAEYNSSRGGKRGLWSVFKLYGIPPPPTHSTANLWLKQDCAVPMGRKG